MPDLQQLSANLFPGGTLTLLNENDLIFFPEDNQSQIPDTLITQIKQKNIRLHPVATLDHVMDILTGKTPPGLKNTRPETYLKKSPQTLWRLTVLIIILMAEKIPPPEADPSKITATQNTTKNQSPEKPIIDHKGFD